MTFRFENLNSLEQFREVERLEAEIWGPIDLVPVPIMSVSVRRGAVLVGAYDGPRLAGFVYSFPALRPYLSAPASPAVAAAAGKPTSTGAHPLARASHWSHTLGVHPDYRGAGLGRALKLAQRERVLALGLDLIEWTYDPLQALNAHLNFVSLGAIVEEYEENVYGESTSPLHGGLPTDRFVCQWWIARPHVERRIARADAAAPFALVSHEVAEAPVVNDTTVVDGWLDCGDTDLGRSDRRVAVDIPLDYTTMLARLPSRAKQWRFRTRALFTHYFSRGYRVVDFGLHREQSRGRYLLTSIPAD
jgi:predicted GNAT superfamily acetyltransferase